MDLARRRPLPAVPLYALVVNPARKLDVPGVKKGTVMDIEKIEAKIIEDYFTSRKLLEKIFYSRDAELQVEFSNAIEIRYKSACEYL